MADGKLKLTREQLSAFLKDHKAIKQFEQLFSTVDELAPDFVNEVNIAAEIAAARVIEALSLAVGSMDALLVVPPKTPESGTPESNEFDKSSCLNQLQVDQDKLSPAFSISMADLYAAGLRSKVTQKSSPSSSGFNVQVVSVVSGRVNDVWLIITPTSGLASGTITLPLPSTCVDRQEVSVVCSQNITTFVVDGNGATVVGAPTTLSGNSRFKLVFDLSSSVWYNCV